jgi:hypothetical protein
MYCPREDSENKTLAEIITDTKWQKLNAKPYYILLRYELCTLLEHPRVLVRFVILDL